MRDIKLITIPGKNALRELDRLLLEHAKTGLYPILLGDAEDYERIEEGMEDAESVPAILEKSQAIDAARWFREKPDADSELYQAEDGDWPRAVEPMGIITHLDVLSHKPKKEVLIGLLKLTSPWEAFAHLGWGGWNDCPFATEHCAIQRYWEKLYGAQVVSITDSVVQCRVKKPPKTRAESMRLAREQYLYCYDIVEQGTETIAALAASLLKAEYWYFWWD